MKFLSYNIALPLMILLSLVVHAQDVDKKFRAEMCNGTQNTQTEEMDWEDYVLNENKAAALKYEVDTAQFRQGMLEERSKTIQRNVDDA